MKGDSCESAWIANLNIEDGDALQQSQTFRMSTQRYKKGMKYFKFTYNLMGRYLFQ